MVEKNAQYRELSVVRRLTVLNVTEPCAGAATLIAADLIRDKSANRENSDWPDLATDFFFKADCRLYSSDARGLCL